MFMVGVLFIVAAFGGYIAPYPPRPDIGAYRPFYEGRTSLPPSQDYPLGTTSYGVDVLSEVIHATKYTVYVAVVVTALSMSVAFIVGAVAGYFGKQVDNILMRFTEVFLVFPSLLFILVFARIFQITQPDPFWALPGGVKVPVGLTIVILILSVFGWASNARITRGEVLRIREMEFVQAERALGASNPRIIFHHLFPNVLSTVIVLSTLQMANAILIEAAVSFLGFGDPNAVTWGQVLNENFNYIATTWWAEVFPGLAVLWSVLGFNLLGDGLADALNPRLKE